MNLNFNKTCRIFSLIIQNSMKFNLSLESDKFTKEYSQHVLVLGSFVYCFMDTTRPSTFDVCGVCLCDCLFVCVLLYSLPSLSITK